MWNACKHFECEKPYKNASRPLFFLSLTRRIRRGVVFHVASCIFINNMSFGHRSSLPSLLGAGQLLRRRPLGVTWGPLGPWGFQASQRPHGIWVKKCHPPFEKKAPPLFYKGHIPQKKTTYLKECRSLVKKHVFSIFQMPPEFPCGPLGPWGPAGLDLSNPTRCGLFM